MIINILLTLWQRIIHDRFHTYTLDEIVSDDDQYNVDENLDGSTDYTIG